MAACTDAAVPDDVAPARVVTAPLEERVLDASGRAAHIVTLRETAIVDTGEALIAEVVRDHAITVAGSATRVLVAFSAHLTDDQAEALAHDPRVLGVEHDRWVTLSAPVWTDQAPPGGLGDFVAWGTRAVGSTTVASKNLNQPRIYILDAGIEPHPDLNVVQYVNARRPDDPATGALWGCAGLDRNFRHANHVAGIAAARSDGAGTLGVAAGAQLVSVSVLDPDFVLEWPNGPGVPPTRCLYTNGSADPGEPQAAGFNYIMGLDWIRGQIDGAIAPSVVNISSNATYFASTPVRTAMANLATPTPGYPGALIVQSAGNQGVDACGYAYGPASLDDGVLVVGAINDHGQAVRPLNGINGFHNTVAAREPGSNFGGCVEMWAPGADLLGPWAGGGHVRLSGTSMAAPHVAGLARALSTSGMTSRDLEAAVRKHLDPLGSFDPAGLPMQMPTTAPLPAGTPRNQPYAELHLDDRPVPAPGGLPATDRGIYVGEALSVFVDSTGTAPYSCQLRRRLLPSGPELAVATVPPAAIRTDIGWTAGTWQLYSPQCSSASGQVRVHVPPTGAWRIDGNPQPDGAVVTLPRTTTSQLTFAAPNATSCTLQAFEWVPDPWWPRWNPLPGYPRTVGHAPVHIGFTLAPDRYRYEADCRDSITPNRSFLSSLEVTITDVTFDPEPGSWWNPARSGTGMHLRALDDLLYAYWYTYRGDGTPIWYLGVLARGSGAWTGELRSYSWTNGAASYQVIGGATITLTSPSAGQLDWQIGAHSGTEGIERYRFGGAPTVASFGGSWYLPGEGGWGVAVDTQSDLHVATLMVYDTWGQPTWVMGVAPGGGAQVTFDLFGTTGDNLCPACQGGGSYSTWPAGAMVSDLTELDWGLSQTTIDALVANGSWYRGGVTLERLLGP